MAGPFAGLMGVLGAAARLEVLPHRCSRPPTQTETPTGLLAEDRGRGSFLLVRLTTRPLFYPALGPGPRGGSKLTAHSGTFCVALFAQETSQGDMHGGLVGQQESFVFLPFDAADHLLDEASQTCEPNGGPVGAVAVRSGAVDNKQRIGWIVGQVAIVDPTVGQVDGSWDVSGGVELGASHVEEHEGRVAGGEVMVDVPTVGLVGEQAFEMCERITRCGSGDLGDS